MKFLIVFFSFFPGIWSPSGETVVILSTGTDTLETLQLSRANLFVFILIYFGSSSSIFLSSELDNDNDLFIVSIFTVFYVSVLEEDPDLPNEGNLFSAIYFSLSLIKCFSEYESDAYLSV